MKMRCENPNTIQYKNYWWRWISIEWDSFEDFMEDMLESYEEHVLIYWKKNTSIDRIDNNWNYCKDNCKWATRREQCNNRSSNRIITYKWETHTLAQRLDLLWVVEKRRQNSV